MPAQLNQSLLLPVSLVERVQFPQKFLAPSVTIFVFAIALHVHSCSFSRGLRHSSLVGEQIGGVCESIEVEGRVETPFKSVLTSCRPPFGKGSTMHKLWQPFWACAERPKGGGAIQTSWNARSAWTIWMYPLSLLFPKNIGGQIIIIS